MAHSVTNYFTTDLEGRNSSVQGACGFRRSHIHLFSLTDTSYSSGGKKDLGARKEGLGVNTRSLRNKLGRLLHEALQ